MHVLVYADQKLDSGRRLIKAVTDFVRADLVSLHERIEGLGEVLRRTRPDTGIAVLLAGTPEELQALEGLDEYLSDWRIILIVSAVDALTVARAHALKPRFLTYADGDFSDVTAVLHRMLGRR